MSQPIEPFCACGHSRDEHDDDFAARCLIDGCDCICFDEEPNDG